MTEAEGNSWEWLYMPVAPAVGRPRKDEGRMHSKDHSLKQHGNKQPTKNKIGRKNKTQELLLISNCRLLAVFFCSGGGCQGLPLLYRHI